MKSYRRTLLSGAGHVKGRPMAFCFGDKKDKNDNLDNEGGRSNGVKHIDDSMELLVQFQFSPLRDAVGDQF